MQCKLNDKLSFFEVDSGSHLSCINLCSLKRVPDAILTPTNKSAKGYGNHNIEFMGMVNLSFEYNARKFKHTFYVIESGQVNLLGRDILSKLNISINVPINNVGSASNILTKYKHFLSGDFKSSVKEVVSLHVDPNHKPIFCKPRSVPVRFKQLVNEELKRLEQNGVITRVFESKYASPAVCVLRQDGKIRLCADYSKTINKYIDIPNYPLPTIDEIISRMGTTKVFSIIDLCNAYLQVRIDNESKQYTTMNIEGSLWQWNFMPFGASSCPTAFQSFISKILSGIEGIVVYLDDILCFSKSKTEHDLILDKVLGALMNAGIKINVSKSKFYLDEVRYLGYVFDKEGVHPCPDKLDAILKAPAPSNTKELSSFVGFCTFYSRFFPNFSHVFAPLYQLLKKNAKFTWGVEQEKCFQLVKDVFKSGKVLQNFNPELETALETDASCKAVAATILQKHNNIWLPIQFASRTLNSAEKIIAKLSGKLYQ